MQVMKLAMGGENLCEVVDGEEIHDSVRKRPTKKKTEWFLDLEGHL